MELAKIALDLVAFFDQRGIRNKKSTARYLEQVLGVCNELVDIDDPESDRATYLHEQLKAVYKEASKTVALKGSDKELLYRALSSARVYYWVRILEGLSEYGVKELLREREEEGVSVVPGSKRYAVRLMFEDEQRFYIKCEHGRDAHIVAIRTDLLTDIAALAALKMRLES